MKLANIEVKGKTLTVDVDGRGNFSANVSDGVVISAQSLEELREKAMKAMATAAVRVSIPVLRENDGKVQRGTFTGIHAANGNYLVKWEGEKGIDQISHYSFSGYSSTQYIDPACEAEYAELVKTAAEANRIVEQFEKKHALNIKALMDKALNDAKSAAA